MTPRECDREVSLTPREVSMSPHLNCQASLEGLEAFLCAKGCPYKQARDAVRELREQARAVHVEGMLALSRTHQALEQANLSLQSSSSSESPDEKGTIVDREMCEATAFSPRAPRDGGKENAQFSDIANALSAQKPLTSPRVTSVSPRILTPRCLPVRSPRYVRYQESPLVRCELGPGDAASPLPSPRCPEGPSSQMPSSGERPIKFGLLTKLQPCQVPSPGCHEDRSPTQASDRSPRPIELPGSRPKTTSPVPPLNVGLLRKPCEVVGALQLKATRPSHDMAIVSTPYLTPRTPREISNLRWEGAKFLQACMRRALDQQHFGHHVNSNRAFEAMHRAVPILQASLRRELVSAERWRNFHAELEDLILQRWDTQKCAIAIRQMKSIQMVAAWTDLRNETENDLARVFWQTLESEMYCRQLPQQSLALAGPAYRNRVEAAAVITAHVKTWNALRTRDRLYRHLCSVFFRSSPPLSPAKEDMAGEMQLRRSFDVLPLKAHSAKPYGDTSDGWGVLESPRQAVRALVRERHRRSRSPTFFGPGKSLSRSHSSSGEEATIDQSLSSVSLPPLNAEDPVVQDPVVAALRQKDPGRRNEIEVATSELSTAVTADGDCATSTDTFTDASSELSTNSSGAYCDIDAATFKVQHTVVSTHHQAVEDQTKIDFNDRAAGALPKVLCIENSNSTPFPFGVVPRRHQGCSAQPKRQPVPSRQIAMIPRFHSAASPMSNGSPAWPPNSHRHAFPVHMNGGGNGAIPDLQHLCHNAAPVYSLMPPVVGKRESFASTSRNVPVPDTHTKRPSAKAPGVVLIC